MVVQHNLASMNANRNLGVSTVSIRKSTEKLSSGFKVNRAADDAAGLTISEKMRSQIRGLTQASYNCQDGISFVQTAEGAMVEVHDMLQRMNELSVKAANGTLTSADRSAIQAEVDQLCEGINQATKGAQFNTLPCFPDEGYGPYATTDDILAANNITFTVEHEYIDANGQIVTGTTQTGTEVEYTGDYKVIADYVVEQAKNAMAKLASSYPNFFHDAASSGVQIGLKLTYMDGPSGTLASAEARSSTYSSGTKQLGYTMNVDLHDFNINNYNDGTLKTTIAHEMTHLIMYDMNTEGMFSGASSYPKWFKEGMAQTSSGDDGWVSSHLSELSTNDQIKAYMSVGGERDNYGTGYLACMYMGYLAGDGSTVSSANIRSGLDSILTYLKGGKNIDSLFEAGGPLNGKGFSSAADFKNKFYSGTNTSALNFIRSLMLARGENGAGSVLQDLNTPVSGLFPSDSSYSSYSIDKNHISVTNTYGSLANPVALVDSGLAGTPGHEGGSQGISIQAGAAAKQEQIISVKRFRMSAQDLFPGGGAVAANTSGSADISEASATDSHVVDVSTEDAARESIEKVAKAIGAVSSVRSYYGAIQNRLEHTIANLDNIVENTTAAESQIRDTDMAMEMVNYTKTNVLIQAGNAMLSQAMQQPQSVLQLLS